MMKITPNLLITLVTHYIPLISPKEELDEKEGVRLAHGMSCPDGQGCPSQPGLLGQWPPPSLHSVRFSQKAAAFAARSPS